MKIMDDPYGFIEISKNFNRYSSELRIEIYKSDLSKTEKQRIYDMLNGMNQNFNDSMKEATQRLKEVGDQVRDAIGTLEGKTKNKPLLN